MSAAKPNAPMPLQQPFAQDGPADASARKSRRVWAIALGTAIGEMAEMVAAIACTAKKSLARDAIQDMRSKADNMRARFAPLPASALAKVVRRAEAA